MKLIIGLGNPGKEYQKTRHNIGFMALDRLKEALAEDRMTPWELSKKFNAEVAGATIHGEKVILAKPMTFMNDSGIAVQLLAHFYRLTHRDIIVVHDEKDLPLGVIKLQKNRGDAGHNGVKSIILHLGTKDFLRLRLGVASDTDKKMEDAAAFVLGKFGLFEKKKVDALLLEAVQELRKFLEHNIPRSDTANKHV